MIRLVYIIQEAGKEFGEKFGRDYSGLVEGYHLEDAEIAFVAMGSICGTIKDAIDEMRKEGRKQVCSVSSPIVPFLPTMSGHHVLNQKD